MLPYDNMDFVPFDVLTAEELDQMVANIESLSDGTGIIPSALTPEKLLTGTGTSWVYGTWAPTWTGISLGTTPTVTYRYKEIGKTVHGYIDVTLGSGASGGNAAVSFTPPVPIRNSQNNGIYIGTLRSTLGAVTKPCFLRVNAAFNIDIITLNVSGGNVVEGVVPIAASTQTLRGSFTYEAD